MAQRVTVHGAEFKNGAVRPAEIACFTADVPATLILNEVTP